MPGGETGVLGGRIPQRDMARGGTEITRRPTTQMSNPRAAAPVTPSVMEVGTARIGAEQATLTAGPLGPLNTRAIPNLHDVIGLLLSVTSIYSSGAGVTGSMTATSVLAQVNIRDPTGTVIMSVLAENFHSFHERFSKWTNDFTDTAVTVVASQSNVAGPTSQIRIPCRLPASHGPYQIDIIYTNLAGVGSWAANNGPLLTAATGLTAFTATVQMEAIYGDAGGYESHFVPTTFGGLGVGVNDIAQNFPVKNQAIAEIAFTRFAADTDLDRIVIHTNGQSIEPHLSEAALVARDADAIQATRPTAANGNVFWLFPSTQFAVNPTTQFQIYLDQGATTTTIRAWIYYLVPAG